MKNQNIQTEVDASYLYGLLAENEEDATIAGIFRQMSEIERSHAVAFLQKLNLDESHMPGPSTRARILKTIGRMIGYDYVLGVLLDTEKSLSSSILRSRKNQRQETSL